LVEHWSPKPGVGRSSRSSRAKYKISMKIFGYFKESYSELIHKVTWPSWEELQSSAIIVMIATIIIALIIAVMDLGFKNLMETIYGWFY
jgi:preprotein translocase subunit SecE